MYFVYGVIKLFFSSILSNLKNISSILDKNSGVLHLCGICEYNSSKEFFAYEMVFRKGKIIDTDYSKNKNKNQIKIRLSGIDERGLESIVNNLLDEFKNRLGKLKTKVYVRSRSTLNTSIAVEEIVTLREFEKKYLA